MGSGSSSGARKLTRQEVERVFARAAQASTAPSESLMSAETVMAIAREVGLPEEAVRDALAAVMGPPAELAGRTLGRYRLLRQLGKGSGGVVYEAEDPELGRRVAVKAFSGAREGSSGMHARFRREAKALGRIGHAHVVAVYDTGVADGVVYLAMEICDGGSLDRVRTAEVEVAERWLREAVLGLREAARHGLLHRDIKPSNLLLDAQGRVKVADFGLVKLTADDDNTLTRQGEILGTPLYMSPEQARGAPLDVRSDIYSLGSAFFHILSGRPPFEDTGATAVVLARRLVEDPPSLRSVAPQVPERLAGIIDRMIRRDAGERFADYEALVAALEGRPLTLVVPQEKQPSRWQRLVARVAGQDRIIVRTQSHGAQSEVHNALVAALMRSKLTPETVGDVASVWQLERKPLLVQVALDPEGSRLELNYKVGRRSVRDVMSVALWAGLGLATAVAIPAPDLLDPTIGFWGGTVIGGAWRLWQWGRKVKQSRQYLEMVAAEAKGLKPRAK